MFTALPDWETLSLAEQVAQMVVVRVSGYLFDQQIRYPAWEPSAAVLRHWVEDLGVGGVILLGGSAAEVGLRSHQLQDWAAIPLLICADIEEGVGQRFSGATWFPPPMALGAVATQAGASQALEQAIAHAEIMGATTAQEALAIGINWLLAPVVDVNNNPTNPVINVRAFGDTPALVSQLATAFLRGAQRHPVLTCAKHFPGHGDTSTDSHLELPLIPHSLERLDAVELPPFKAAIAAGVDAIMSAHLLIPAVDSEYPATLSRPFLTGQLRQRLGFEGLIVTDALVMGAITNRYGATEAPVLAVEAGADILMMPVDPEGAIAAICDAVNSGRISPEQIRASVARIWQAKQKVCTHLTGNTSHAWETLPPPLIQLDRIAQPAALSAVAASLRQSMQVHQPAASRLHHPKWAKPLRNLIVLDDALDREFLGHHTAAIALPQKRGYTLQILDSHTPPIPLDPDTTDGQPTLLQLFIRGNPFRGSAGLNQVAKDWFEYLLRSDQLQALVIYGSPYILNQFVPQLPADVPYVFTYGQMPQAQAIALEALFE